GVLSVDPDREILRREVRRSAYLEKNVAAADEFGPRRQRADLECRARNRRVLPGRDGDDEYARHCNEAECREALHRCASFQSGALQKTGYSFNVPDGPKDRCRKRPIT